MMSVSLASASCQRAMCVLCCKMDTAELDLMVLRCLLTREVGASTEHRCPSMLLQSTQKHSLISNRHSTHIIFPFNPGVHVNSPLLHRQMQMLLSSVRLLCITEIPGSCSGTGFGRQQRRQLFLTSCSDIIKGVLGQQGLSCGFERDYMKSPSLPLIAWLRASAPVL